MSGYTLVELVMTMTIVSIVALIPAAVLLESMRVYVHVAPTLDAAYQARFATARIKADIRGLDDPSKLVSLTSSSFSITDASNTKFSYVLVGGRLLRNGDLLAEGVDSLTYRLKGLDGKTGISAAEVNLVEIDLSVKTGDTPYRVIASVCPGFARYDATPSESFSKVATP